MRFTLIEILVCLVILIIIYWIEATGIEPAKPVALVIVYTHWFFFGFGLMAVGLPPAYVIKKLYDKLTSRLPEKMLFWINESRRLYPDWHEYIDWGFWLGFLPFAFGTIIIFVILYIAGINIPFMHIFYGLPIAGAFYLPLSTTDFMERKMGIIK
ncbi:hypothetical protein D9Q81_06770 [Candidatus Korarchaeum cryptofilum]|uniref:Uncharacterized protein n=1 Tax=Candidatus Korarchaeum cryptofilum TaxID=498846 RepID=A0A429G323_9CREN|nr:hypothetical protein [Candidatus Korarchaeum cryptofilum]RSN68145.1 hypothetical protein D9Q81_06770 [Candidatus Korarchaeum cryptofilum]